LLLGTIILMILGLALKMLFIEHPLESDDTGYMEFAKNLSAKTFCQPESQLYFRTGILIPLHLLMRLSGYSIYTYYIFSVGFSMLLLLSLLLLSRQLFGLKVAMLTGLLVISSSLIAYNSTNLLPDTPAFFWAVLSMFFFVRSLTNSTSKYWILLSALTGFMAYLCKEPVLVFFAAFPLYEYYRHKSIRYSIVVAVMMIFLWLGESAIYWIITGDPLIREKTFAKGVSNWIVNQPRLSVSDFFLTPLLKILHKTNGKILFVLGLTGAVLAVLRKNRKIGALLVGGTLIFIIYTYSFYSLKPLIPNLPPQLRYVTGFFCVLSMVAAWSLIQLFRYLKRIIPVSFLRWIFCAFILVIFSFQVKENFSNLSTLFFHKDTYFVADRLIKGKIPANFHDSIYTYPLKDFDMYPNFSRLPLKQFNELPAGPCYLLYSRNRLKKNIFYARKAKNDSVEAVCRKILNLADSLTIFEYGGIVFSHVPGFR